MDGLIRVKNNPAKKATAGKRDLYYYYRREARCTLCLPGEGELLHKAGFKLKVGGGRERKMERKKKNMRQEKQILNFKKKQLFSSEMVCFSHLQKAKLSFVCTALQRE